MSDNTKTIYRIKEKIAPICFEHCFSKTQLLKINSNRHKENECIQNCWEKGLYAFGNLIDRKELIQSITGTEIK